MPLPSAQLQEIAKLLEAHPFRLAKTAVRNPHWYTLRHEWTDVGDDVFNDVVRTIREHGVTEWFGTYPRRMLLVNGCKYWTYYSSYVKEVIVPNRKPTNADTTAIVRDLEAGDAYAEVAARYGHPLKNIYTTAHRYGIRRRSDTEKQQR